MRRCNLFLIRHADLALACKTVLAAGRRSVRPRSLCLVERAAPPADTKADSVLIESEPKLQILVLTRFLHANRSPLCSKTL